MFENHKLSLPPPSVTAEPQPRGWRGQRHRAQGSAPAPAAMNQGEAPGAKATTWPGPPGNRQGASADPKTAGHGGAASWLPALGGARKRHLYLPLPLSPFPTHTHTHKMDAKGPAPEQSLRCLTPRGSGTAQSSSYPDRNRDMPPGTTRFARATPTTTNAAAGEKPPAPSRTKDEGCPGPPPSLTAHGGCSRPVPLPAKAASLGDCRGPASYSTASLLNGRGEGAGAAPPGAPQRVGARRGQSPAAALRVLPPARPRPVPSCRRPGGLGRAAEGWGSPGVGARRRPGSSAAVRPVSARGWGAPLAAWQWGGDPHNRVFSVKNTHADQHMQA